MINISSSSFFYLLYARWWSISRIFYSLSLHIVPLPRFDSLDFESSFFFAAHHWTFLWYVVRHQGFKRKQMLRVWLEPRLHLARLDPSVFDDCRWRRRLYHGIESEYVKFVLITMQLTEIRYHTHADGRAQCYWIFWCPSLMMRVVFF